MQVWGLGSVWFWSGLSLTQKKKNPVQKQVISKEPAGTPCAQPWLWQLAVGGWRQLAVGSWQLAVSGGWWWLAAVGGWRLVVGGSWQWLAVGGWSPLAVGGGWWLAVGGGWWRLAVDGSWRLAVGGPLGLSLRAVLSKKKKKKISFLKDAPGFGLVGTSPWPHRWQTAMKLSPRSYLSPLAITGTWRPPMPPFAPPGFGTLRESIH